MATGRSKTNKGESKLTVRLYKDGKSYKVIEIIAEIEISQLYVYYMIKKFKNEGNILTNKPCTRRSKENLIRE